MAVPARPGLGPTLSPLAAVTADQAGWLDRPCDVITCEGAHCSVRVDSPASQHFWFRRTDKSLVLAGMALYGGT